MILRVNGEFLDFDGDIEIEKKAKLFENISENSGDFSYSFDLPNTSNNRRILGIQNGNVSDKLIYQKIECDILNNGFTIYSGFLRIEVVAQTIRASFFSGGSNWISSITGSCLTLNLNQYTESRNQFATTWSNTEGVIITGVDTGLLEDRIPQPLGASQNNTFQAYDLQEFVYAKTVIERIFLEAGLKIAGSILEDTTYNKLVVTSKSTKGLDKFIVDREAFIGKSSSQSVNTSDTKITFTDIVNNPYFPPTVNNYASSAYTADIYTTFEIEVNLILDASVNWTLQFFVNGGLVLPVEGSGNRVKYSREGFGLDAGQFSEIYFKVASGSVNVMPGSYVKYTPINFQISDTNYTVYPQFLLPIDRVDFVKSVFTMFNTVIDYNNVNKTVTVDLFKDVKNNTPYELLGESSFIEEVDFIEFISSYGKKTSINYNQSDSDQSTNYNRKYDVLYGDGLIEIDNGYIQDKSEIPVDFTSSVNYFNNQFGFSVLKLPFIQSSDNQEFSITSSANVGGLIEFTTSASHGFLTGDYVRIYDTNTQEYEGNGVVLDTSGLDKFRIQNLLYGTAGISTGSVTKLTLSVNSSDDVYIGLIKNIDYGKFAQGRSGAYFANSFKTSMPYVWFSKPFTGLDIDLFKESLAFSPVSIVGHNDTALLERYYSEFVRITSDPLILRNTAYITEKAFTGFKFKYPLYLRYNYIVSLFYVNRISGYKGSHLPCEVELIKLS